MKTYLLLLLLIIGCSLPPEKEFQVEYTGKTISVSKGMFGGTVTKDMWLVKDSDGHLYYTIMYGEKGDKATLFESQLKKDPLGGL